MIIQKQLAIYNKWFIFILLMSFTLHSSAQCAGNDATTTICDKFGDENNQTFDLFSVAGFNGTAGGTWSTTEAADYFALNQNTGSLNLWRINNAGTHIFTYTNNICGQSATITIDLGAYSGIDNIDGSANACSDDTEVNLNRFIGDPLEGKVPDVNGIWEEDPSTITGFLVDNIFDAEAAGPGEYIFTYSVSAVGTCPSSISTVILEVHPRANSGTGSGLTLCNYEDLSPYTSFNLNSLLQGEDSMGTWSEVSTNQLSDLSDNIVDIQEIYNTHGIGTYSFTYIVFPTPYHPVCNEEETTVSITILPTLEGGTMETQNYCVSQNSFPVALTYNNTLLPNGVYDITYSITGVLLPETVSATLNDGNGSFNLEKNTVPTNQLLELNIQSITGTSPSQSVCDNIFISAASFLVTDPSVSAVNGCVNTDVAVNLNNIFASNEMLSNQNHDINYIITDPNNNDTIISDNIVFTNGVSTLLIPAVNFTEGGDYDIAIKIIGGLDLGCEVNTSVSITPTPSEISLDLIVDNNCNASQIDVIIDAPILDDGTYSITYDVIDQLTNNVLTQNNINFTGGTASYQIDVATLTQGDYTVRVRSTQNDTTPCRLQFDFELTENFAIMGTPSTPVADALQDFCLNNYASSGPTLEDIQVTANGTILFYATATDNDILPLITILVDGEDYFISNTNLNNNCEGSDRVQVVTTLSNPTIPITSIINPEFCEGVSPTLSDLTDSVFNGDLVVWYDALTNGNLLDNSSLLSNDVSYYASTASTGGCHSTARLEIAPTIHILEPAAIEFTTLSLCSLDEPTVANLSTLENEMLNYEVQWYDVVENGNPLDATTSLTAGTTYYAQSYNPITGCINSNRVAVFVELTNCEPEEYDFFIPDGFSPNADGRNDYYFIPNIEVIYPNFTIEIINRYGNTMFVGDKNKPKWDGTNNGNSVAPNGVYFYIINYNKEGVTPVQGRLYLNR